MAEDRRIALVERTTAAVAAEIDRHDPAAPVPWPWWPDVRALIGHLGGIHAWAAEVVRTGEPVPDPEDVPAPPDARAWYEERRSELLVALRSRPADAPCWVFTGADPTVGFWRRRMVFETTKHLMDLRASGGGAWIAAPELGTADFADGVDELLTVFLARSRPDLPDLPASVRLVPTDLDTDWRITTDWRVEHGPDPDAAEIRGRTADLALVVWDRAVPLDDPERFAITGSRAAVAAFCDASIHP